MLKFFDKTARGADEDDAAAAINLQGNGAGPDQATTLNDVSSLLVGDGGASNGAAVSSEAMHASFNASASQSQMSMTGGFGVGGNGGGANATAINGAQYATPNYLLLCDFLKNDALT